jgi:hypothetical protein
LAKIALPEPGELLLGGVVAKSVLHLKEAVARQKTVELLPRPGDALSSTQSAIGESACSIVVRNSGSVSVATRLQAHMSRLLA